MELKVCELRSPHNASSGREVGVPEMLTAHAKPEVGHSMPASASNVSYRLSISQENYKIEYVNVTLCQRRPGTNHKITQFAEAVSFWAIVCKTVRPMLSDPVSYLSCL